VSQKTGRFFDNLGKNALRRILAFIENTQPGGFWNLPGWMESPPAEDLRVSAGRKGECSRNAAISTGN
jgi:hypothetical protein